MNPQGSVHLHHPSNLPAFWPSCWTFCPFFYHRRHRSDLSWIATIPFWENDAWMISSLCSNKGRWARGSRRCLPWWTCRSEAFLLSRESSHCFALSAAKVLSNHWKSHWVFAHEVPLPMLYSLLFAWLQMNWQHAMIQERIALLSSFAFSRHFLLLCSVHSSMRLWSCNQRYHEARESICSFFIIDQQAIRPLSTRIYK